MVTQIMGFFLHWVPAYTVDTVMRLLGKEPFLVKVAGKVQQGIESLEYFTTREWIWANDNTVLCCLLIANDLIILMIN